MPWKEKSRMDQKFELVEAFKRKQRNVSELSREYEISRPTVYKWLRRYEEFGYLGLKEESRAPYRCPHRTSEELIERLIDEKRRHRKWGPRKIRARLKQKHPEIAWPSISATACWLEKAGLVERRRTRQRVPNYQQPLSKCLAPNDVWSIDYKGQFRTQDGRYCYALTVTDNYSRMLLCCDGLSGTNYEETRRSLERVFREYGLPKVIRTDNGVPFAGRGVGGLSRLAVWWISLGIVHERIAKGCPQENGRHERMHRSLKAEALERVGKNLKSQQRRFDEFRMRFNYERPHEALEDRTPSEYYVKSPRPYVSNPPKPEYDFGETVRMVRLGGEIKLKGRMYYLTGVLRGLPVGLKEIEDGLWQVRFSFYTLATINLKENKIIKT